MKGRKESFASKVMVMNMKKIGHRVSVLHTKDGNPRNGEGTFLRLRDDAILYAYTRYSGSSWDDHASADIAAIRSYDEGETWSEPQLLLARDADAENYMCISLLRMQNGDIGMFYLRKYRIPGQEGILSRMCLVRSRDEGKTWSCPVDCTSEYAYHVFENDHAIMLSKGAHAGRILLPMNAHSVVDANGQIRMTGIGRMFFAASDDDGRTWFRLSEEYTITNAPHTGTGLQETIVYEQEDGILRAFSRTDQLCQYECHSFDGGRTWTDNHPFPFFSSPASPLNIRRACSLTCAVFNPTPAYLGRDADEMRVWGRTPLVIAVSEDDGTSFPRVYAIEDDPKNGYCYPAIFDGGDYILVGYYHSDGTAVPLNANVITKISKDELLA